jgi:hypothetical protein
MRGTVKDEILSLRRDDGKIYPIDIVEYAHENEDSALHQEFPWDVEEAAKQHWLWKARQLISVHVVNDFGKRETINLKVDWTYGGGYRRTADVVSVKELRRAAIDQALEELSRWCERYEFLDELEPVRKAIRLAILKLRTALAAGGTGTGPT